MLGVQAAGVAPIADEIHESEAETDGRNDVADGIQITTPARAGQIRDAIAASGGDAMAVEAAPTERAHERLCERGFYVEPTSAVAVAGLDVYRDAWSHRRG